jgi:serine/threonine-protein kinase RsbW
MPPKTPRKNNGTRRILGRVPPEEFVGRADELQQILRHAAHDLDARALLLLLAPAAGVSELLRQAYDQLFGQRGPVIPIYFALTRNDRTASSAARQFLNTFLQQFIAFRRNDPSLNDASPTVSDLLEMAAPSDYEWIERLVAAVERARGAGDERALIRLCLSAPQRASAQGSRAYVMLDGVQLTEQLSGEVSLGAEIVEVFMRSNSGFVLAGLRRQILDLVHGVRGGFDETRIIRLERLNDADARALVEHIAGRGRVAINEQTRDLIVQQFSGSPFFITALVQAARDRNTALTSYLNCQQLYVDEVMGGRINRHFGAVLEEIAPSGATRRALIRLLYETTSGAKGRSQVEIWRKKLGLEEKQFRQVTHALHVHELITLNADFVEVGDSSSVWGDYLLTRYRMEVEASPRALVVAETLLDVLKRAPQTMARHYRREAALGLRDLLTRFNCQRVPASLLHYDRFSHSYKGMAADEMAVHLDAETDLIRLPQIVHAASCTAFNSQAQPAPDEERCAVAHGFDAGNYTDANEVVWVAAEIDSKLEAGRGLTEMWCDRLAGLARSCGFNRVRLWLVAPEGFSADASLLLAEREAYGSSRQQLELLTARINADLSAPRRDEAPAPDEFELAIPMGDDTELIAAHTVEQIARRIDFQPEAINQIKTALIEACINATEHSLSPDRKIYQRFRVESDRLIVTVSSRGVILPNVNNGQGENANQQNNGNNAGESAKERRGWGLKLIRTLMDEVEFERVDDGTRLRMTKYLKKP